jgi:Domain of unknown function (DUF4062)
MDKVYQVFVSSTFADLEVERKEVSDNLAKAGFIPAGMELFPATSLEQFEFIKKVIDRCDYYVVITGARYGSLDGDKSFTEKEYEYALSRNIPVLAFVQDALDFRLIHREQQDVYCANRQDQRSGKGQCMRPIDPRHWTSVGLIPTVELT